MGLLQELAHFGDSSGITFLSVVTVLLTKLYS